MLNVSDNLDDWSTPGVRDLHLWNPIFYTPNTHIITVYIRLQADLLDYIGALAQIFSM